MKIMKGIRILLVDDGEIVRRGLRDMLEQEEDMEIVGDCSSAEEALPQAEILSPNIVLMEAKMPGIGGIEATRRLRQKRMPCNVIMLTLYEDCLADALQAGATGFLLKDIRYQELIQAIKRVYHGELVIDKRLTSTPQASERKGADMSVKEVELIIPLPIDAARLLRFIYQVEETLDATIVQQVGSWHKGTAITILLRRSTPLAAILDKLGKMPDVEVVRRKPTAKHILLSFPNKIIARPETHPRKELLVTLKQADTAKQSESAALKIS
jgi:DNA-binding NarL/FixJ family response regulator